MRRRKRRESEEEREKKKSGTSEQKRGRSPKRLRETPVPAIINRGEMRSMETGEKHVKRPESSLRP